MFINILACSGGNYLKLGAMQFLLRKFSSLVLGLVPHSLHARIAISYMDTDNFHLERTLEPDMIACGVSIYKKDVAVLHHHKDTCRCMGKDDGIVFSL